MNLKEERDHQKLAETLEALELSKENDLLAKQYLDMSVPENRELLAGVQKQNFSGLDKQKAQKSRDYLAHLTKRRRMQEIERYVRFTAAAGGATAYYVLFSYGWNLGTAADFLTPEQKTAVQAEGVVWNNYALSKAARLIAEKDPQVIRRAMELCYHKSANAKTLLAGLALRYTKARKVQGGFLKGLFSGAAQADETLRLADDLAGSLTESIPNLFFAGGEPSDLEMKQLVSFAKEGQRDRDYSAKLRKILQGRQVSEYLLMLLSGAAFLAIEHSGKFVSFLRLMMAIDAEKGGRVTLNTCLHIGGKEWFLQQIGELEEVLSFAPEDYMLWCIGEGLEGPLGRMVKKHPDAARQVQQRVPVGSYSCFMAVVQKNDPGLYREMNVQGKETFLQKMAQELTGRLSQGQQEAQRYLLGEAQLDDIIPYLEQWRSDKKYYYCNYQEKLQQLKSEKEGQQMFRRMLVLEGFCGRTNPFTCLKGTYRQIDKQDMKEILEIFEEEALPARYQLEILAAIHDNYYAEKDKTAFLNLCVMELCRKRSGWEEILIACSREGTAVVRFICIRVLDVYWQEYRDVILACALDSARQVRELLEAVYASHREWEPQIRSMLGSKKSAEREMAVLVLGKWGTEAFREDFERALETEKSRKIRELLEKYLGRAGEGTPHPEKEGAQSLDDLAKGILKGGRKRKVAWVFETPLPQVHRMDGTEASEEYLAALLVTYADMGTPGIHQDAARLAADLQSGELADFMNILFGKWMDAGAEAKKKWVLYAASIHGGEGMIQVLYGQIQEWPRAARGAMAAEAVRALALNGSPTALLLVDQISRKFKFRQVKSAAAAALTSAAKELGISREELEDRIVPDLGFDEKMEQTFDYGSRSFTVMLSPSLELEVYDENGKKLKNLPAPGKKDDLEKAGAASDRFKQLKKQLKTVAANQKLRLEQALSAERLWQAAQWRELFVRNPVMHQFAIGLIWGLYDQDGLKSTFRYMEDGSFNTLETEELSEEEYELPEEGTIGLVHPIELSEEMLAAWKEQLSDYEITQPFEQLSRPVYPMTEEERGQKEMTRFGGMLLNGLSLSGKLQGQGWFRGSVEDGGVYSFFYREDGNMGVELEFSGSYVGDENDEVTVYGAQFYRAGSVNRGSYVYDSVKEKDRYALSEVSPRYFSEVVLQLTKATASSQERVAYPECKKG